MTFVCTFVCTVFLLAFEVAVDLPICFLKYGGFYVFGSFLRVPFQKVNFKLREDCFGPLCSFSELQGHLWNWCF